METLSTAFKDYIKQVARLSTSSMVITEDNVFQEGSEKILPFLDKMVEDLILPGSGLDGFENLEELFQKARAGKACLLLPEHYSNLDLSLFSYLVRKAGASGAGIDRAVVALAGMKLNEENPVVSAFASAYTRIVIYPSRSLQHLDIEKDREEIIRSNRINRAAMKALLGVKNAGRIILIFPSGTRYRPWDPSSRRGVREIDSYIRTFDYMCLVAINGEVLHVHKGDMMEDEVSKDVVRVSVGPVLSCGEFRDRARAEADAQAEAEGEKDTEDKKQAVVDAIMAELEKMHMEGEKKREHYLK